MNLNSYIDATFPPASDFLDLEEKTFKKLLVIRDIQQCAYIYGSINQALSQFQRGGYTFHCNFPIHNDKNLKNRKGEIFIGAKIITQGRRKYKCVSYAISISLERAKESDSSDDTGRCLRNGNACGRARVIRRFHFDYDLSNANDTPRFHLQFGGKPEDQLSDKHYCLEGWLESPRFFFPPMSISLIFDCIFREFSTELGKNFLKEPTWIKLVKESEDMILKPYYKACFDYLKKERKKTQNRIFSFIHWHYGFEACKAN